MDMNILWSQIFNPPRDWIPVKPTSEQRTEAVCKIATAAMAAGYAMFVFEGSVYRTPAEKPSSKYDAKRFSLPIYVDRDGNLGVYTRSHTDIKP